MMKLIAALLVLVAVVNAKVYFKEEFGADWEDRWVNAEKSGLGKFVRTAGDWYGDAEADQGIQTSQDARFYATSAMFDEFSNEGKDLVIQFQVRAPQKIDCGGMYLKLLPSGTDQENFNGDTDYLVMFGPDICGTSTKRIHAIFAHDGENLLIKKSDLRCETDQLSHVYTFIIHPDSTYEIRTDGKEKASGNLKDDWAFELPAEIPDESAEKPADWVDEAEIADPEHVKPDDYEEGEPEIPDPNAESPDDWDDELDGEWEAPMIPNPDYKPWKQRKIANPEYKGPWKRPTIANPDFVEKTDVYKYDNIGGIGIDIWQVKSGSIFDNIIITDDVEEAEQFMAETFTKGKEDERAMFDAAEAKKKEEEDKQRKKIEEEREKQDAEDEDDDDEDDEDDEDDDEDDEDDEDDDEDSPRHEDL